MGSISSGAELADRQDVELKTSKIQANIHAGKTSESAMMTNLEKARQGLSQAFCLFLSSKAQGPSLPLMPLLFVAV